jgi:hypothetical protein
VLSAGIQVKPDRACAKLIRSLHLNSIADRLIHITNSDPKANCYRNEEEMRTRLFKLIPMLDRNAVELLLGSLAMLIFAIVLVWIQQ